MPRPGRAPRPLNLHVNTPPPSPALSPPPLAPETPVTKGLFRLRNGIACVLLLSSVCASFVASQSRSSGSAPLAPFSLRRTTIRIDPNARGWARPGRMDGSAQAFRPLSTQGDGDGGFHRNLVFDPTRLAKGASDAGSVESTPEVDAAKEAKFTDVEDPGGCGHGGKCFNERPVVVELTREEQHAHDHWVPESAMDLEPKAEAAKVVHATGLEVAAQVVHAASSVAGAPSGDEYAADLHVHKSNERGECWSHFDLGSIEAWDSASQMLCAPTEVLTEPVTIGPLYSAFVGPKSGPDGLLTISDAALSIAVNGDTRAGWLRCRITSDAHLPPATAPHTLCDGANVVLNVKDLTPTPCLPSRGGYKCEGPNVHWLFPPNSLTARCSVKGGTSLAAENFPRDHLRDLFAGWAGVEAFPNLAATVSASGKAVVIIARERDEHANLFHATSDWLNAFISLSVAGIVDSRSGERTHMADVQILLLDEQTGPFEENFIKPVFSPSHPVLRVSRLKENGVGALHMSRALFVPPGYSSMLLSHVMQEGDCHAGTQLLTGFRAFILGGLGIDPKRTPPAAPAVQADPVRVLVISRRPYTAAGIQHPFVGRQVDNEDAFIAALEARPALFKVRRVDMATLTMPEQVALVATETDVLVGMHGAALTHALYLPPWAAVVELWPKETEIWRCFEHLSTMAGLSYERWANAAASNFRADENGDYTTLDLDAVVARVEAAAAGVRVRWVEVGEGAGALPAVAPTP